MRFILLAVCLLSGAPLRAVDATSELTVHMANPDLVASYNLDHMVARIKDGSVGKVAYTIPDASPKTYRQHMGECLLRALGVVTRAVPLVDIANDVLTDIAQCCAVQGESCYTALTLYNTTDDVADAYAIISDIRSLVRPDSDALSAAVHLSLAVREFIGPADGRPDFEANTRLLELPEYCGVPPNAGCRWRDFAGPSNHTQHCQSFTLPRAQVPWAGCSEHVNYEKDPNALPYEHRILPPFVVPQEILDASR